MNILLLGEFSGLHYNLAKGLKKLGHSVTIASNGDYWKNYPRDIDLDPKGPFRKIKKLFTLLFNLRYFKGYDVVQLINPNYLDSMVIYNKLFFKYLYKNNKAIFLGANGNDYYYIHAGVTGKYSKSVFNFEKLRNLPYIKTYVSHPLSKAYSELNIDIAQKAKGITACCAEYQIAYEEYYPDKTRFIPLPIQTEQHKYINTFSESTSKIKFFLGHYKDRGELKGTDVINEALKKLEKEYPNDVELTIVDSVPFEEYHRLLNSSHILCDQLYSYGCGMNGALGLSKGLIIVGGADERMYSMFNESSNKPMIDLPVDKDELYKTLEEIVLKKDSLLEQAHKSREFAVKHHDYIKVAQEYLDFWKSRI